jgi:AcrR family transcriptional regulator
LVRAAAEPVRARILDAAQARFFAHGFSRVTVDELAADLGISKKTLYAHFRSKDALLGAVMERFTREIAEAMDRVMEDRSLGLPARAAGLLDVLGTRLALLDRALLEDLNRHAPLVWKRIEAFRRERIFRVFGALLTEGAAQGHFRRDLDPGLILQIYFHSIQNVLHPRTLSTLPQPPAQVFRALVSVLFEGMLTDRGRRAWHRKEP